MNAGVQFQSSTLQAMLTLPEVYESVDYTADELSQVQINEENLPLETSTVNSGKENSNDDLTAIREVNLPIRFIF